MADIFMIIVLVSLCVLSYFLIGAITLEQEYASNGTTFSKFMSYFFWPIFLVYITMKFIYKSFKLNMRRIFE